VELTYNQAINGCPKSHLHNKLTLVAIKEGSLKLLLDDEIFLSKNRIAIINPNQVHSAFKMDIVSKDSFALYLDKIWVRNLQQEFFETKDYVPVSLNIIEDKSLYRSFIELCHLMLSDVFVMKKEECLIEFTTKILLKYCERKFKIRNINILSNDIKAYLDSDLEFNLSINTISKEFHISAYHLIRIFKKDFGLTPYQYILSQKINKAKELISQGKSISDAAQECGFNDQSHLYKYFKDIFSITPKQYQKSII